jgi:tRNA(Ile)-lysidine synthase
LPELAGQHTLTVPGITELPGWRVTATVCDAVGKSPPGKAESPFIQSMDFDASSGWLTVRARRPGDLFRPLGMPAEKSIKDFFIDAKVPRSWRPRVPIVVNLSQVIWVAGYRLDDRVKVTESTKRILRLEFAQSPSTSRL